MNFIKKSLVRRIRSRVRASKGIKALLLLASDLFIRSWGPISLSYSLVGLAKKLLQGFCQIQDLEAIAIEI